MSGHDSKILHLPGQWTGSSMHGPATRPEATLSRPRSDSGPSREQRYVGRLRRHALVSSLRYRQLARWQCVSLRQYRRQHPVAIRNFGLFGIDAMRQRDAAFEMPVRPLHEVISAALLRCARALFSPDAQDVSVDVDAQVALVHTGNLHADHDRLSGFPGLRRKQTPVRKFLRRFLFPPALGAEMGERATAARKQFPPTLREAFPSAFNEV